MEKLNYQKLEFWEEDVYLWIEQKSTIMVKAADTLDKL
jgi:hypothetical protein